MVERGENWYEHSLITNPWGELKPYLGEDSKHININVDVEEINTMRNHIPSLSHDKAFEF